MRITVAALAAGALAVLLMFQNCGQGLQSASIAGSNSGASGTPPPDGGILVPPPGGTSFAKGDAFNYNSLPNKSQMLQTQIDQLGYTAYAGVKAIAVNAQVLAYIARKGSGVQSDANTSALEGCFALGGGSPCALIAVGDKFEISSADLPASYTFTMTAPTALTGASIPFVMPNIRNSIASMYGSASSPKALVFSVDGAYNWVTASDTPAVTTLAEARRVALERCELNAAVTPCTVFAENDTVVFNPAAINRTPAIDYARTAVMTNVPGMKETHYNSLVQPYLTNVNGTTVHGVIYIAGDGAGGLAYNSSATTAETNAKNFCEANVSSGFTCFRYAVDKTVQSVAANLFALKNFPVPHCKSVPRATCAAHRAMGCGPGMYYTMNGTAPALENCL
jgi:hypothetical protein